MVYVKYIYFQKVTDKTFTVKQFQRVGTLIAASLALRPIFCLAIAF